MSPFPLTTLYKPFTVKLLVSELGQKAQMKLGGTPLLALQGILSRKTREVSKQLCTLPTNAYYHFTILSQVAGLGARTKSSNEIKRNPLTVTNYTPQPRRTSETSFIMLASN